MTSNGHGHKIDFAARRKTIEVEVPELETTIRLRALSVGQARQLREHGTETALLQLAMSIVDEHGQRIYTTDDDLANLEEMAGTVFQLLITKLNELHGVSAEEQDRLVKKSEASRDIASDSASPDI